MKSNKPLRNEFSRKLQDLETENYKILLKEIKEQNKQKHILFIDQNT